jgi:hypothetical protein
MGRRVGGLQRVARGDFGARGVGGRRLDRGIPELSGYTVKMRADVAERTDNGTTVLVCLAAWLVPGGGHLWLGRRAKGLVFLGALVVMFALGLVLQGRLFPFEFSQPLVGLAAMADVGIGVPYFLAWSMGWGQGQVVAVTYEYGNAFLIVAGLLNMLVVLDAYDTACGRKPR